MDLYRGIGVVRRRRGFAALQEGKVGLVFRVRAGRPADESTVNDGVPIDVNIEEVRKSIASKLNRIAAHMEAGEGGSAKALDGESTTPETGSAK